MHRRAVSKACTVRQAVALPGWGRLHSVSRVTGAMLWTNLHLLFWLSLMLLVTGWTGENHFAAVPSALCGGVLLAAQSPAGSFSRRSSARREATRRSGR